VVIVAALVHGDSIVFLRTRHEYLCPGASRHCDSCNITSCMQRAHCLRRVLFTAAAAAACCLLPAAAACLLACSLPAWQVLIHATSEK
jgi:hypothetical protein